MSIPRLGAAAAILLAVGCRDAVAPSEHPEPGSPVFVEVGTQPAIRGVGTLGTGAATAGSDLQEFDFDVAADLTGRLFYRDWRFEATLTVDPMDPETGITAFRDGSAACADPTHGAEFDATGRRESGALEGFTVLACDDGAAESGADGFMLTTVSQYSNAGLLSSGDIVKTVVESSSTSGDLTIMTATTGEDIPAGYTFSASGPGGSATDQPIVANDTVTFTGVVPGDYTVELSAVPANCTLSTAEGPNPRTINVPDGGTGSTTFSVSCVATTPTTGDLTITTATTGDDLPSGYTLSFSGPASSGTVTFGANQTQTFSGIAAGDYTLELTDVPANCTVVNGTHPRTVTVPDGDAVGTTFEVSCTAAPPAATRLVFTGQPSNTTAGSTISPAVQVTAQDDAGNTATGFTGTVTVAIGTNPGGGTLSGTKSVAAVSGVATFSDLSINKVGSGYTLTASASGLSGATSASFNITPGSATKLVFSVQPSNTLPLVTMPPVEVKAEDAFGNKATSFTGEVTIAIGKNGGLLAPGKLSGTLKVNAVNGYGTFKDLSIDQPGTGYTLVVTSPGLKGAESASFDVLTPLSL